MTTILSIDPGVQSGWAVWTTVGPTLLGHGTAEGDDTIQVQQSVRAGQDYGCAEAFIEDQYVDTSKANYDSVKKLIRSGGRWAQSCGQAGMVVHWIYPASWQSAMLGKSSLGRRALEKIALLRVKKETDRKVSPHEADAILIGRWAIDNMAMSQLVAASGRGRGVRT